MRTPGVRKRSKKFRKAQSDREQHRKSMRAMDERLAADRDEIKAKEQRVIAEACERVAVLRRKYGDHPPMFDIPLIAAVDALDQ